MRSGFRAHRSDKARHCNHRPRLSLVIGRSSIFSGVKRLFSYADEYNGAGRTTDIKDGNFITAGHSGGGGLTAALTLKVVGTQAVNIAFQMPVYPMLDHRMQAQSAQDLVGTMVWDRDTNALA